jgi:hypothetical protein
MYNKIILLHPNLFAFVLLLSLLFKNTIFFNKFSNPGSSKVKKKQVISLFYFTFESSGHIQGFFHTPIASSRIIQNTSPGEAGLMIINFALRKIYSIILDFSAKVLYDKKEVELPDHKGYKLNIAYNNDVYPYETYEFLGEFATWDDLPIPNAPNKIAIDKNTNTVLIFKRNEDEGAFSWQFYSDNIYEVIVGEGKEEISADFSTLPMHLGRNLLTSQTKDLGTSPCFDTGDNDLPLTILFYRGMQQDSKGDDYPMASSVNYTLNGAALGDYQIKMNGDNGLYNKFLLPWYEFLENTEEFKRYFNCDSRDFFNIAKLFLPQRGNPTRKIRVDSMNCIPKKVTFVISSSGIMTTEMILLQAKSSTGGR